MANATLGYLLHSGKNSKAGYYLKAGFRDIIPDAYYRKRLQRELDDCHRMYDESYIENRVNYYCKLQQPSALGPDSHAIGDLRLHGNGSTYYFDSRHVLQWFDPELRWNYLFGDVRTIPPYPTVVKSRALGVDNSNSVLLKLNRCRHYIFLNDHNTFESKFDRAIYRGQVGSRENRIRFCQMFASNPRVDLANTLANGSLLAGEDKGELTAPRLSLYDHLKFRYIMALEGNDVASNLKWVMSTRSLAVMPRPTCESWYMEGQLVGGEHYVEVAADYSDLEAKLDYYSSHEKEANEVADNANRYVQQFRDERRERYIGLLVMQKYFKMTNP